MIGIYLLVTIFSQFSPVSQLLNTWPWEIENPTSVESTLLDVSFDQVSELSLGSLVIAEGRQVGEVSQISTDEKSGLFTVSISVNEAFLQALNGPCVALQASPMSVSRKDAETVIELIALPGERKNAQKALNKISGFSSIEQFWSDDSKLGA